MASSCSEDTQMRESLRMTNINIDIKENFIKYLTDFEYDDEPRAELLSAMEVMLGCEEAVLRLKAHVVRYIEGELDFDKLTEDAIFAAELSGIHEYHARFIYYAALVPYALPYFEAVGLGREEWYDSMIDFKWKMNECHAVYGIWGTSTAWFKSFFTAKRVAFGRLQFNMFTANISYKSEKMELNEDTPVVTVHIPSDTRTPFSKEQRLASYRRAEKYFSRFFPDGKVIFRCGSWLLSPAHREILPEGSNIRSFLDDFEIVPDSYKSAMGDLWRIFYTKDYNGDPDSLPENTSLMRAYKKYLKEGGEIGLAVGFRAGAEG